jgi:hypothetical protein
VTIPTTTTHHHRPSWRSAVTNRAFIVHYLQMLAGMVVLGPLSMLLGDEASAEVEALLMATWMTAGMAAWMAWRRHPWPGILEMTLAMNLAFVVLFPLHWLGQLSMDGLILLGHVIMLPAMATAMLGRREEYLPAH